MGRGLVSRMPLGKPAGFRPALAGAALMAWFVAGLLLASDAFGQPRTRTATLASSGTSTATVELFTGAVGVIVDASAGTGFTLLPEATVDGSNWSLVPCALATDGAQVFDVSASGTYQCGVGGMRSFRVRRSAASSGTITLTILQRDGLALSGASGGGGAGGNVTVVEGGNTAQVTTTAGGSIQVECTSGCGGSGGSSIADNATFTPGTTSITAIGGEVDDTATSAATEGRAAAARLTVQRGLHTNPRDNAGAEIFTAAAAAADNTANLTAGGLRSFPHVFDGTTWDRWTGAVTDGGGSLTVDAPVGTPAFVRLSDGTSAIATLPVSLASVPSHAVTNAGTFAVQESGGALTALELIDNLPNTQGSTTSGQSGILSLGAVTTAAPTYTTAQTSPLSLTTDGALRVAITSGAGSGGTSIADDAAFTVGSTSLTPVGGTYRATLDTVNDGDAGAFAMTPTRSLHTSWRKESDGSELGVAATAPIAVRLSDGSAFPTPATDYTHDAALTLSTTAGPAVIVRASTAVPTAVSADNDGVVLWADRFGRLVTVDATPSPGDAVSLNATSSGNTTVIAAPGAGLSIYVRRASVHNRDTANVLVALTDGAAGTVRWRAELVAEGGGSLLDFGSRGLKLTANTALVVNLGGASSVDVNILDFYIAP